MLSERIYELIIDVVNSVVLSCPGRARILFGMHVAQSAYQPQSKLQTRRVCTIAHTIDVADKACLHDRKIVAAHTIVQSMHLLP